MKDFSIAGIIFSNMHEGYLGELTARRSCGSVPFGGRYRLIDFMLSNMVAAKISNVGVITKSNYKSLMDHLGSGRDWDLSRKRGGLVLLPPFAAAGSGVYHGKAEALYNSSDYIRYTPADAFVLCDCNYIFNIDIRDLARRHFDAGADVTCVFARRSLSGSGLTDCLAYDINGDRITGLRFDPNTEGEYNCSLNMMMVSKDWLLGVIDSTRGRGITHFEKEILQQHTADYRLVPYEVSSTVLRVGCLSEYYSANLKILDRDIRSELFYSHPVYTKVRDEMPARYGLDAVVSNSAVADGCCIEGEVSGSVLFRGVTVGKNAKVRNCIFMQGCTIEEGAAADSVVADKNVVITRGRVLVGCETNPLYIPKRAVV